MKVEQATQVASKAIEQLSQALESGQSGALKQYLGAIARFHRYSWHNIVLIATQKPAATHVAGFNAWHKLGRFVKKGEKGIMILAPVVRGKAGTPNQLKPTSRQPGSDSARPTSSTSARPTGGNCRKSEASAAILATIASA